MSSNVRTCWSNGTTECTVLRTDNMHLNSLFCSRPFEPMFPPFLPTDPRYLISKQLNWLELGRGLSAALLCVFAILVSHTHTCRFVDHVRASDMVELHLAARILRGSHACGDHVRVSSRGQLRVARCVRTSSRCSCAVPTVLSGRTVSVAMQKRLESGQRDHHDGSCHLGHGQNICSFLSVSSFCFAAARDGCRIRTDIGPVVNNFDRGEAAHAGGHSDDACGENGGNAYIIARTKLQSFEEWEWKTEDCDCVNRRSPERRAMGQSSLNMSDTIFMTQSMRKTSLEV